MTKNKPHFVERRKENDIWLLLLRLMSILGWVLFVVALVVSYYAGPERVMGMLRYKIMSTREHWLFPLTDYLLYLLIFNGLLSIITIIINHYRSRRASDLPGFNSFLLLVTCSIWALYIAYIIK